MDGSWIIGSSRFGGPRNPNKITRRSSMALKKFPSFCLSSSSSHTCLCTMLIIVITIFVKMKIMLVEKDAKKK